MPRPLLWLATALALPVVAVLILPLAVLAALVFVPLVVTQLIYARLLGGAAPGDDAWPDECGERSEEDVRDHDGDGPS